MTVKHLIGDTAGFHSTFSVRDLKAWLLEVDPNSIYQALNGMLKSGIIQRRRRGEYAWVENFVPEKVK